MDLKDLQDLSSDVANLAWRLQQAGYIAEAEEVKRISWLIDSHYQELESDIEDLRETEKNLGGRYV